MGGTVETTRRVHGGAETRQADDLQEISRIVKTFVLKAPTAADLSAKAEIHAAVQPPQAELPGAGPCAKCCCHAIPPSSAPSPQPSLFTHGTTGGSQAGLASRPSHGERQVFTDHSLILSFENRIRRLEAEVESLKRAQVELLLRDEIKEMGASQVGSGRRQASRTTAAAPAGADGVAKKTRSREGDDGGARGGQERGSTVARTTRWATGGANDSLADSLADNTASVSKEHHPTVMAPTFSSKSRSHGRTDGKMKRNEGSGRHGDDQHSKGKAANPNKSAKKALDVHVPRVKKVRKKKEDAGYSALSSPFGDAKSKHSGRTRMREGKSPARRAHSEPRDASGLSVEDLQTYKDVRSLVERDYEQLRMRYLQMCSRGDKGAGRKQEDRERLQQLIDELRDKGGILHLLSHRVAWTDPARRTVASSLSPREFQVTGTRDMKRR